MNSELPPYCAATKCFVQFLCPRGLGAFFLPLSAPVDIWLTVCRPPRQRQRPTFHSTLTTERLCKSATSGNTWHDECSCQANYAISAQSETDRDGGGWWWWVSMSMSQKTVTCNSLTDKQKEGKTIFSSRSMYAAMQQLYSNDLKDFEYTWMYSV